jgi:hypothetical protein
MSGNQTGKKHETSIHQSDMKTRSPEPPSDKPKAGSVNDGATRDSTAKTPSSISSGRVA